MNYLRYRPEIEQPDSQEQETIDGIIRGMTQQSETVEQREHHAVRASHAKSSALVTGTLKIAAGLPPELAQGLFATPRQPSRRRPFRARSRRDPGRPRFDASGHSHQGLWRREGRNWVGTMPIPRTLSSPVGRRSRPGRRQASCATAPSSASPPGCPRGSRARCRPGQGTSIACSHAFGTESPKADFFGHPFSHPLSEPYFSQAPIRFGDYVAKLGAFPASDAQAALKTWQLDPHEDEDGFRHAATGFFSATTMLPTNFGRSSGPMRIPSRSRMRRSSGRWRRAPTGRSRPFACRLKTPTARPGSATSTRR